MSRSFSDLSLRPGLRARFLASGAAALTAVGFACAASGAAGGGMSAQPLAFGDVPIGSAKTLPLTITNVGTQTIVNGGIVGSFRGGPEREAWSAVFTSTCPPTPAGLVPGDSCSVDVTFAPKRKGQHKTHLVLVDSLGDSLSVTISGRGV